MSTRSRINQDEYEKDHGGNFFLLIQTQIVVIFFFWGGGWGEAETEAEKKLATEKTKHVRNS